MINSKVKTVTPEVLHKNTDRLLFFSGSNSENSINQLVVETLAAQCGKDRKTAINLRDYPMPLFSEAEEQKGIPDEAKKLLKVIQKHDCLIIAVPEYNSGMPAFFKNTLDWISRAEENYRILQGKQVILLSVSPGNGGYNAALNTQIVLLALGADVVGIAILNDFYNKTTFEDSSLIIKDTVFISRFNTMINLLK